MADITGTAASSSSRERGGSLYGGNVAESEMLRTDWRTVEREPREKVRSDFGSKERQESGWKEKEKKRKAAESVARGIRINEHLRNRIDRPLADLITPQSSFHIFPIIPPAAPATKNT